MNTKALALLLIVCVTIITCAACITIFSNNKKTNNVVENPLEGVILEIKENTLTDKGFTLMIKNVAPNDYVYGSPYQVEKKTGNNWEPVPDILDGNYAWTMEARMLKGNSIREEEIHCFWLYGELGAGDYRVIKEFAYSPSSGINGEYYPLSVKFTIDSSHYVRSVTP